MKKLSLLLVALTAIIMTSCDPGSSEDAEYVLAPVEDVTMATSYKVDSISEIMVRYKRPDDCHIFQGYYYSVDGMTRTCAIEFVKLDRSDCQPDEVTYQIPLRFKPQVAGTYTFRFWDGSNQDGTDHFFVAEAVVEP